MIIDPSSRPDRSTPAGTTTPLSLSRDNEGEPRQHRERRSHRVYLRAIERKKKISERCRRGRRHVKGEVGGRTRPPAHFPVKMNKQARCGSLISRTGVLLAHPSCANLFMQVQH